MSGKKTLKHRSGKRLHTEQGSKVTTVFVNNTSRKLKYKLPINLMSPTEILKAKQKNKANTQKNRANRAAAAILATVKAAAAMAAAPTSTSTTVSSMSASELRRQKNAEKRRVLEARQKEMARVKQAEENFMGSTASPSVPAQLRTVSNFEAFLNRASKAAKARKTAKAAAKLRGENSSSSNNE